jgi:integrase
MKAGREHRVPLFTAAMSLLAALLPLRDPGFEDWIFRAGKNKPLSNMAMLMLLRRMGRRDINAHGSRTAFRD